jgi:hypothetical protein
MKKVDSVLKDYVSKLPFDGLKYLIERLDERVGSDLAEVIEYISKNPEVDKLLSSAKDYEEFWTAFDMVAAQIEKEYSRRTPDLVSHG